MAVQTRIQFRRGTVAAGEHQWTNQILYAGEVGYETDTNKFKIGDGVTAWDSLLYAAVLPSQLDELVDDRMSSFLVAGANIGLKYDDGANTLTISSTGVDTEQVQDIIGGAIAAGTGINVKYDDAGTGLTTISLADTTIQVADITDFSEGVDDRVSGLLIAGSNISLTYDDTKNTLSVGVSGLSDAISSAVSTSLSAGSGITLTYDGGADTVTIGLGAHTHAVSDITGVTATATELNYVDITTLGTAEASKAVVLDSNKDITGLRDIGAKSLTLSGDLTVNGTVTTINSTTITVDDKNLELGSTTSPNDTSADGGGITLKGASNHTFNWIYSTASWTSSENLDLASGKVFKIAGTEILSATQYVGNASTASSATKLTTARTINGTSFDGSANITIGSIDGGTP